MGPEVLGGCRYAYVMRPHTLPPSYWNFIVRTGPIHRTALAAVRRNVRGRPVDLLAVNEYIQSQGGSRFMTSAVPPQVNRVKGLR